MWGALATKPDGSQTLLYEQSRPTAQDHATKSTADGEALTMILEIAAAVITLILALLTDGVSVIIALLVSNSTNPIRWPGGSDFQLTYASMNDSLQLGGNPGFA